MRAGVRRQTEVAGPLTKRCPDCGETKALSDFPRNAARRDGRGSYCSPCATTRVRARHERQRAEMGEEAFLEHRRQITARSRQRRGMDSERAYNRARWRVYRKLAEMYPKAFEQMMAVELDIERRKGGDV